MYAPNPAVACCLSSLRVMVRSELEFGGEDSLLRVVLEKSNDCDGGDGGNGNADELPSVAVFKGWKGLKQDEVADYVKRVMGEKEFAQKKTLQQSASPIITLALRTCKNLSGTITVTMAAQGLPVGAGLGSSAALSTAAAASLLFLEKRARGGGEGKVISTHLDENTLERINELAFISESVLTGTPSGIDNTVSCYGGAVRLRRVEGGGTEFERLKSGGFAGVRVAITNTKIPRSTRQLVAGVREMKDKHRTVIKPIFQAISAIVDQFCAALGVSGGDKEVDYEKLFELIRLNQTLLDALGVGHQRITEINEMTTSAFSVPTKLTGAGGGGCVFSILPPTTQFGDFKANILGIDSKMEVFTSLLGGDGVKIVE